MKQNYRRVAAAAASTFALTLAALAQPTPATPASSSPAVAPSAASFPAEEVPLILSPFEVKTGDDSG